jgi:hypothetical protein
MEETTTVIAPPPPEKKRKNVGRPVSDKQREALRKGMEAMKAKRELMSKEKEERKAKGLPEPAKVPKLAAPVEPVVAPRKPRKEYVRPPVNERKSICRDDFNALRTMVEEIAKKPPIAPVVGAVAPAPTIVEKVVYLTGKPLLDKIFNFN